MNDFLMIAQPDFLKVAGHPVPSKRRKPTLKRTLPQELIAARTALSEKGWSYRTAAPHLGVCWQHIALVLTGRRESNSLFERIEKLEARSSQS